MTHIHFPRLHRRAAPLFDWRICESETEYRSALLYPLPTPTRPVHIHHLPTWAALGVCLLVGCCVGVQLWRTSREGLDHLQQKLDLAVEADLWRAAHGPHEQPLMSSTSTLRSEWEQQTTRENTILQGLVDGQCLTTTTELLELGSTWTVVQVMTEPALDQPAYRQTRVYVETDWGWVRVPPRAAHWGRSQRLESSYFIFHYFTRDAQAVQAAAALLDARYPALYAAFFPEPPAGPKLVVEVTPEQAPGEIVTRAAPDAPFVTASPGIYFAPVTISDAELLAQALVLSLLDELIAHAQTRYAIPAYWTPVLDGVRLWQLWQTDLPLAAWRAPLVDLIYPVSPAADLAFRSKFGPEFCAEFRQWMSDPLEIRIPLICHMRAYNYALVVWGEILVPPLDTSMPAVTVTPSALQRILKGREILGDAPGTVTVTLYPGTAIAEATALEYAATAYGPETIPALLAALAEHGAWTTLAPAVFGVSAAEFDAGWHTYLMQHFALRDEMQAPLLAFE